MATDTIDRLLEHVQMVYASEEEEHYYLFDKGLDEERKEYEKWVSRRPRPPQNHLARTAPPPCCLYLN